MKLLILLLFSLQIFASEDFSKVYPLLNDNQALESRIEILLNPNLKEFVFSTYILKLDEGGMLFLALLKKAADRGVKIKGIVDSKVIGESPELYYFLKENNIELHYYNPILFEKNIFLKPFLTFQKWNKRLHDKIWSAKLFDANSKQYNYITLVSDKNISLEYYKYSKIFDKSAHSMKGQELLIEDNVLGKKIFSYFQDLVNSEDIHLPLKPRLSEFLWESFNKKIDEYIDWLNEKYSRYSVPKALDYEERFSVEIESDKVQFLSNISAMTTYEQLLQELKEAKPGEEIYIENPYFILEPKLIETLKLLKAKSCKVTLVSNLPSINNVWIAGKALEVDLEQIAKLGVEVYLIDRKSSITHAKLAVIGNRKVYLGSANFDPRSLNLNSESGLLIEDESLALFYKKRLLKKINDVTVLSVYNGQVMAQKATFSYKFPIKNGNNLLRCLSFYKRYDNYKINFMKKKFINFLRPYL